MPPDEISWRDVRDLIKDSQGSILAAVKDVRGVLRDHEDRLDVLEGIEDARKGSRETVALFLGLPQKVIGTVASAVALVLALATVWSLVRPMS
jgi:hypothetical protein